jgi:hypothetical protein
MSPSLLLHIETAPEATEQNDEFLQERALRSARQRFCRPVNGRETPSLPRTIAERLGFELELISRTDSAPVFLAAADLAAHSRQSGRLVCSGTGHLPCSLVAYALGITDINPLRYGLPFERMIDPDDPRPPRLGLAVDSLPEASAHLRSLHGPMLVHAIPDGFTEALELTESPATLILKRLLDRVERATGKRPKLEEFRENDAAAWALLNRGPRGALSSQEVLEAGLMEPTEADTHGLARAGASRPVGDDPVREVPIISFGGWDGGRDFPVASIEDLALREASRRPTGGAWDLWDSVVAFLARRAGTMDITTPHPLLEPVLAGSQGALVWQEQLVHAASVLTGWSLGQANRFRRAMARARPNETWAWSDRFVTACVEQRQIPRREAEGLAAWLGECALVVQSKSHHLGEALTLSRLACVLAQHPEALSAR